MPNNYVAEAEIGHKKTADARLILAQHALEQAKKGLEQALDLINQELSTPDNTTVSDLAYAQQVTGRQMVTPPADRPILPMTEGAGSQNIVEGVFDGQNMVGSDGKQYSVPANYASKSKLVEGDILKLTITGQGSFIYKQIGPIERNRVVARLEQAIDTKEYIAVQSDIHWRVLTASVTYFKGAVGDEIVILVPQLKPSKWAAVENIIKKL